MKDLKWQNHLMLIWLMDNYFNIPDMLNLMMQMQISLNCLICKSHIIYFTLNFYVIRLIHEHCRVIISILESKSYSSQNEKHINSWKPVTKKLNIYCRDYHVHNCWLIWLDLYKKKFTLGKTMSRLMHEKKNQLLWIAIQDKTFIIRKIFCRKKVRLTGNN